MEASSSSRKRRQRRSGSKDNTLYVCFFGDPMGYAIRSISQFNHHCPRRELRPWLESSASKHDYPSLTRLPPLSEVWCHYDEDEIGVAQGCVLLDSKLYFVGSVFPKPGSSDDNKSLICYNLADRSVTFYPGMSVRHTTPIVFSANNRIFVLSTPNRPNRHLFEDETYRITDPGPAFEVFNLSTQKWETLLPPPFFDPQSDYYHTSRRMTAHAVIGGYFCVSTRDVSFKCKVDVDDDDVKKMIWEPCMLFQDHPHPRVSSTRLSLLGRIPFTRGCIAPSSNPCGHPFPFKERAILFGDDILISMALNKLVAYKMVGDRVVKSQSFTVSGVTETSCFSDIGDGLLSIVSVGLYIDSRNYAFHVKLLCLDKKKEDGDGEKFLQCEVVDDFSYHFENTEIWSPVYCFVR